MSAGFQRRATGSQPIVGEVTIGSLPESFSNMARNLPAGFGKLLVKHVLTEGAQTSMAVDSLRTLPDSSI